MNINYNQVGDYQYPNLKMDEVNIQGKYAMMRADYLKNHQPGHHFALMCKGMLNTHLQQVQTEAEMMVEQLIEERLKKQPAPNKENDQMEWVQFMNTLKMEVEEIVLQTIVYN
ncbi:TnpV protein [Catenibacterium mitsuokai]|nr:TnpV protein [Catenibacterium mitsuokai]